MNVNKLLILIFYFQLFISEINNQKQKIKYNIEEMYGKMKVYVGVLH